MYRLGVWVVSLRTEKAKQWIAGRSNWRQQLASILQPGEQRIWIHCSSLGEFEQGKPLIEAIRQRYPGNKIVLTFFSPSGYEVCKNYRNADYIFYLPMDGRKAARDFVAAVDPKLVLFVKYEFWYHYLYTLKQNKIPLLLVSGAFRPGQSFFKWYGGFFRTMLGCFSHLHVQDGVSAKLLEAIGFKNNVSISGDTRYDRVTAIRAALQPIPLAALFKGSHKILIAGSTWPDDEAAMEQCMKHLSDGWKLIVAPHETDTKHIGQVQQLFGNEAVLYSELTRNESLCAKRVLIIDNIGMLSSLYAYGDIAYVGGGFQKGGIHNVLEPAVFGIPVVMGPVYRKFVEAVSLTSAKVAFPVQNADEAAAVVSQLANDDSQRKTISDQLQKFMKKKTGATERIMTQMLAAGWLK